MQLKVQRKGAIFEDFAKAYGIEDVKELKLGVMNQMAVEIVNNSPVDSGTYVTNHEAGLRSGSFKATAKRSDKAPRRTKGDNVSIRGKRAEGLALLRDDIKQLDLEAETFVFRNPMEYASLIEAGVTSGHENSSGNPPVYAATVREAPRIIQEVAQRIASRNR